MDERWLSFVLDDTEFESPGNWRSWVILDEDDEPFKSKPESPRIKCMRFDKTPGFTPPYSATAPAYFLRNGYPDDAKRALGLESHKASPLRNIALSNVPERKRHDSSYEGSKEKPARRKWVSFGETVQVLEIDLDSAVEEQAWAHYPELARCKDWDGRSARYEKTRNVKNKLQAWALCS